jgi:replicative DNA helicase
MIKKLSELSYNEDKRVYIFSIEESAEKITNLFASRMIPLNSTAFKNYSLTPEGEKNYKSIKMSELIYIDDERMNCGLEYIERKIELMSEVGVKNYFIDTANEIKRTERNEKDHMDKVASTLKDFAKKYDCRIFALSQTNRQSEGRDRNEKRPQVYDIKGSDQCYQNADNVIGLYFDDFYKIMYNESKDPDNIFEVSLLKSRDGIKGVSKMFAEHGICRFSEIENE